MRVPLKSKTAKRSSAGRFEPGGTRPARSGRRPGAQNRVNKLLKEAVLEAAASLGEDGGGKNGLVGYCRRIAKRYPALFVQALLCRILPMQVQATVEQPAPSRMTLEEMHERLRQRGIPTGYDPPMTEPPQQTPPGTRLN